MHVNKKENRIIYKIKAGYDLELLTPKTMILLRSTKKKRIIKIQMVKKILI